MPHFQKSPDLFCENALKVRTPSLKMPWTRVFCLGFLKLHFLLVGAFRKKSPQNELSVTSQNEQTYYPPKPNKYVFINFIFPFLCSEIHAVSLFFSKKIAYIYTECCQKFCILKKYCCRVFCRKSALAGRRFRLKMPLNPRPSGKCLGWLKTALGLRPRAIFSQPRHFQLCPRISGHFQPKSPPGSADFLYKMGIFLPGLNKSLQMGPGALANKETQIT